MDQFEIWITEYLESHKGRIPSPEEIWNGALNLADQTILRLAAGCSDKEDLLLTAIDEIRELESKL